MDGLFAAFYFLFSLCFSAATFILWVRFALRYFHVSTLNPMSQWVYQLTEPVVKLVRRLISQLNSSQGRYDWPCLILLFVIEVLKFILVAVLFFRGNFPWLLIAVYPLADMLVQALDILLYAILIRVIISWVNPSWRHPLADLLIIVTEPTLHFARRYIPDIAGIDFSPFVVLIVIKAVNIFISATIPFHLI